MTRLASLLAELDETQISRRVALRHDEARLRYRMNRNTVGVFEEYVRALGDYYNYHFSTTVMQGGRLQDVDAQGYAKQIVQHYYERKYQGNLTSAFHDARNGTKGGLRTQLDLIAETLKAEATERYVQGVLDRYIDPTDYATNVDFIRQFMNHFRLALPSSVDINNPERYARDSRDLVRGFVYALQETSGIFRRG